MKPDDKIQLKKNILLVSILALSTTIVINGVAFLLRAQSGKEIPKGYTALSYLTALDNADKNRDGHINGLDAAYTLKRYGKKRMMVNPKFGDTINSLEQSFLIANFNVNVVQKKAELLSDAEIAKRYTEDIIVANESTIPPPNYLNDDKTYNGKILPPLPSGIIVPPPIQKPITSQGLMVKSNSGTRVLGESGESAETRSGGEGTSSKGSDSGRSIIPSILGTVSSYSGSAGFDYPISVPSGPGGFSPSLGLSYSSGYVDDALPFDRNEVIGCKKTSWNDKDEKWQCDEEVRDWYYRLPVSYVPSYAGYGFAVNGSGSIVRDTGQEKDVYVLKGDIHHRFILNLPTGLSVELKFNKVTQRWTSIPEGFVRIEHAPPAPAHINSVAGEYLYGQTMPGSNFKIVDGEEWVITASDGSKYYFGEQNLASKLDSKGMIPNAVKKTVKSFRKTNCNANHECEKEEYDALHHTVTQSGGIYNEYDVADFCNGISTSKPCDESVDGGGKKINGRIDKGNLLVTKWLLRRMESVDGKVINYEYDNYQKFYGEYYKKDGWTNNLAFATVDSYLREINWNDNKHRVVLYREDRPDTAGTQFVSMQRLARIDVETKLEKDNKFHLVRQYKLGYANDDSAMDDGEGKNEWGASLLTSLQEFGTDGVTKTPAIVFKYNQIGFEKGPSGSTIYLSSINNGYGGETKYVYQPFNFPLINGSGDAVAGPRRARVIEKRVLDKTSNPVRVLKETYDYKDYSDKSHPEGTESSLGFANRIRGDKVSGREFLGHKFVEVRSYDFNSDKLLSHSKTQFHQSRGDWNKSKDKYQCFEPSLNKGRPATEIVYNILADGSEIEAKKSISKSNYRILGWNQDGKGQIVSDNLDPETKKCEGVGMTQPYFTFTKYTITTATEKESAEFAKTGVLNNLKVTPVNTQTVKSENLEYDIFGNLLKSVAYGLVNAQGEDIDSQDNRYEFASYLGANQNWLNNLPYVTYSSNKLDCSDGDIKCQYGKTITWYDQFYGDFTSVKAHEQKPVFGFVTQQRSFIDDEQFADVGTSYQRLSDDPRDLDNNADNDTSDQRRGGVESVFAPKPNVKKLTDHKNQIAVVSTSKYDSYYKTLVIESKNALGHKTIFEDFDYLIQSPRVVKKQLTKDKEEYTVAKVLFDPLGRKTASFLPDPNNPGYVMGNPAGSFIHYFDDGGDTGLKVRTMSLISQTKGDDKFHYSTTDIFYDGLGKVKQTQLLSKKVDGQPKRLVSDTEYNGAGNQTQTFEPQLAEPVTFGDITYENSLSVLTSNPPTLVSIPHKVLSSTNFDGLNRPVESTSYDLDNNFKMVNKTYYYTNAQKTVSPKGVISVVTTDHLGRSLDSLVVDPTGDNHLHTYNEYEQEMIDQPTTITYKSIKDLDGGNKTISTMKYNKSGRVTSATDPSLGSARFEYDLLGNKIFESRKSREDIEYEYDLLGRLVKTNYLSEENGEMFKDSKPTDIVYKYDDGDYALGKVTAVTDHMGTSELSYDKAGRLRISKRTVKDKSYSMTQHYNILSQVVATDYPGDQKYEVEYDDEGVAQITRLNGKQLATNTIFDKYGKPRESSFVLGESTEQKSYLSRTIYDSMGRLTQFGFARNDNGSEVPYFFQNLKYDQYSQINPLTEGVFNDGQESRTDFNYEYDSFGRLSNVKSSKFNTDYAYDPFGRIQSKNEGEKITLAYNDKLPFFAPKSVTRPEIGVITPTPTEVPTSTPLPVPTKAAPVDTVPTKDVEPTPTITQPPLACTFHPQVRLAFENPADKPTQFTAGEWGVINDKSLDQSGKTWEELNAGDLLDFDPEGNIVGNAFDVPSHRKCCTNKLSESPNDKSAQDSAYTVAESRADVTDKSVAIAYLKFPEDEYEVIGRLCGVDEKGKPVDCKTESNGTPAIPLPHNGIGNLPLYCGGKYQYTWVLQKRKTALLPLKSTKAKAREGSTTRGLKQYPFDYDDGRGVMLEDDKHCFGYNRLSQLISMKIKKDANQRCKNNPVFTTQINFFYDYAGTLLLKEEYKGNGDKLSKQTYYFGTYEDIYESSQ